MRLKSVAVFTVAVGVFLTAAAYRFHDSAHAIGRLTEQGGEVRHSVHLDGGRSLYTIIVTGVVMPPYHGDAHVTIEGDRSMTYRMHNSEPAIDMGLFRRPRFRENTFYDLRARDKVALWVVLKPQGKAGEAVRQGETVLADRPGLDCCDVQPDLPRRDGHGTAVQSGHRLSIAFRDTRTGKPILNVPIIFRGEGGAAHGSI